MTLSDFCYELHNWFEQSKHFDEFTIENGALQDASFLKQGQYFRIVGSTFNDGVYQYPTDELTDETFAGAVWAMAIPPNVLALFNEIQEWDAKYSQNESANSPFQSETMQGVYSYTKSSSTRVGGGSDDLFYWQGHFRSKLNRYRKV